MTYTYKSKLFCEPSTIFKATTIFIMTSLHIPVLFNSVGYLAYKY